MATSLAAKYIRTSVASGPLVLGIAEVTVASTQLVTLYGTESYQATDLLFEETITLPLIYSVHNNLLVGHCTCDTICA